MRNRGRNLGRKTEKETGVQIDKWIQIIES